MVERTESTNPWGAAMVTGRPGYTVILEFGNPGDPAA